MTLALYPGSFDPITFGHLNLIDRSLAVFDELLVAVASNVRKQGLFTFDERMEMIREVTADRPRVTVSAFEGLLVDYARKVGAKVIVRGLRAVSDFEYEFQMAHMNRRLHPDVDTVFMMTGEDHFFVSSALVREVAALGGSVADLVPASVERRLQAKLAAGRPA